MHAVVGLPTDHTPLPVGTQADRLCVRSRTVRIFRDRRSIWRRRGGRWQACARRTRFRGRGRLSCWVLNWGLGLRAMEAQAQRRAGIRPRLRQPARPRRAPLRGSPAVSTVDGPASVRGRTDTGPDSTLTDTRAVRLQTAESAFDLTKARLSLIQVGSRGRVFTRRQEPPPARGGIATAGQPIKAFPDQAVAFAAGRLEARAVEHRDLSAVVADEARVLEGFGGDGDTRPPDAEHLDRKSCVIGNAAASTRSCVISSQRAQRWTIGCMRLQAADCATRANKATGVVARGAPAGSGSARRARESARSPSASRCRRPGSAATSRTSQDQETPRDPPSLRCRSWRSRRRCHSPITVSIEITPVLGK